MITEDYVSYEVAKLLKNRGFDEQTVRCYNLKHELCKCQCNPGETINSTPNYLIAAPTLQMACKWLREVHHIHIDIIIEGNGSCITYLTKIRPFKIIKVFRCNFYEEAVEVALKYTLENLI